MLHISNLHFDVTEDALKALFAEHCSSCKVHSVEIQWDKHDRSTGEAYVTVENPRGAQEAVELMDGKEVEGQPIKVSKVGSTHHRGH